MSTTSQLETPRLSCDQVLRIASTDAEKAYRDLSRYSIRITEEPDGWHVDYELKDPRARGGGPHYVIEPVTGTIVAKRYEQQLRSPCAFQQRDYSAAEPQRHECLTIREKQLPDDCVLFNTKIMLGGALAGRKKFPEAEPLLVEGYSGMKEREANIPPAAQIRLAEAIQRLIDLYTAWDKPEEAAQWREKLKAETPLPNGEEARDNGRP